MRVAHKACRITAQHAAASLAEAASRATVVTAGGKAGILDAQSHLHKCL